MWFGERGGPANEPTSATQRHLGRRGNMEAKYTLEALLEGEARVKIEGDTLDTDTVDDSKADSLTERGIPVG